MMDFHALALQVVDFVRANEHWALPVVFILSFGESLAFVSVFLPATVALLGIGGLIGASGLSFFPICAAAALGATLGDWLSYWLGVTFKEPIGKIWPLSRYPDLLPRGHAFVERFGFYAIFLGRFFGPLRAIVPLVAGILTMPFWPFQLANVSSAIVWAVALMGAGYYGFRMLML